MERFDVVVVGAGAMGTSIAYHLARMSSKVLVPERFSLNHDLGSSHGRSRHNTSQPTGQPANRR